MTYWNQQSVGFYKLCQLRYEVSAEKTKYLIFWFCNFWLQFISWYFLLGRGKKINAFIFFPAIWKFTKTYSLLCKSSHWYQKKLCMTITNGTWTEAFYTCLNFNNYYILQHHLNFLHEIAVMWHDISNLWTFG